MPIKNDQFGLLNILAICGEVPDQLHIIYTRPSIAPIRLLKKPFCFYALFKGCQPAASRTTVPHTQSQINAVPSLEMQYALALPLVH